MYHIHVHLKGENEIRKADFDSRDKAWDYYRTYADRVPGMMVGFPQPNDTPCAVCGVGH